MKNKKTGRAAGKQTSKVPTLLQLAAIAALLMLVEFLLILSGALPQVFSYSPGNLAFSVLTLALIVYAGWLSAGAGLLSAAKWGAALGAVSSASICALAYIGREAFGKPILGIAVFDGMLLQMLAFIVIENTLFGAIIAVASAFICKTFFRCKQGKN